MKSAGFHRFEELALDDVWRRYLPGEPPLNLQVSKIGTAFVNSPTPSPSPSPSPHPILIAAGNGHGDG